MSASLFFGDRSLTIECMDDEPVLTIQSASWDYASLRLTPRNIEQLEAAIAEARKYHAMEPA